MTARWAVRRDATLRGPQWTLVDPSGRDVAVAPTQAAALREIARRARTKAPTRRKPCGCGGCDAHDGACAMPGPFAGRCSRCVRAEREKGEAA